MAGRSVGSIGIDVHPDTSTFNRELKAKLEAIEKKNSVDIPVHLRTAANRRNGEGSVGEKIRDARDEIQSKVDASRTRIQIPLSPTEGAVMEETRRLVDRVNTKIKAEKVQLKIPVTFDNEQVARDLRRAITSAQETLDDKLKLKVKVEFDSSHLRREWESLKEELNNDTIDLKADLDRQGVVRTQIAALTRNRFVDLIVRVNKRSVATAEATLAAISGENLIRRAGLAMEALAQNLDLVAFRTASAMTKFGMFSSSLLASTSSVLALTSGLGQLGAYALTLPAFAGGLISAAAALKVAFTGFGDAITDPESIQEQVLAGDLPAAMYKAAKALNYAKTQLGDIIQDTVWRSLDGGFENLVTNLLPTFEVGMRRVSDSVGRFVKQSLDAFGSSGSDFELMFNGIAGGLRTASGGMATFIRSFMDLARIGAQHLPDFGKWFADTMGTFERWVARSEANGNINQWIDNARQASADLGRILVGIKGTLSGLVSAASDSGGGTLGSFADTMERVRRNVESNSFQDGLRNLFRGAHDAIQAVQNGLSELGWTLLDISPVLTRIMSLSGESVGGIFSAIANALKQTALQSGAVDFFTGVRDGLKGMLEYLPNVARGLGNLGSVLGKVFEGIGPVIGTLFGGVADVFSDLTPVLKELTPILTNFSANAIGGLVSALTILAQPLKILLEAFNSLPGVIQTALLALLLLRRFTGNPLQDPTRAVTRGLNEVPNAADRARRAMSRPLGENFLSPRALAPLFEAISSIPNRIGRVLQQSVQIIPTVISRGVPAMLRAAGLAASGIASAFGRAVSGLAGGVGRLGSTIAGSSFLAPYRTLGSDIARSVAAASSTVGSAARNLGLLASEAFRRGFATVGEYANRVISGIAQDARQVRFPAITNAFRTVSDALTSLRVASATTWTQMRNGASAMAGGLGAAFAGVRNQLSQLPGDFRFLGQLAGAAWGEGMRNFLRSHLQLLAGELRGGQGFADMRAVGQRMANTFAAGWGALSGYMSSFVAPAFARFTSMARDAVASAGRIMSSGWSSGWATGIRTDLDRVVDSVRSGFSRITSAADGLGGIMRSAFSRAFSGISGFVGNYFSGVTGAVRDAFTRAAEAGGSAMRRLGPIAGSVASGISSSFKSLYSFLGGGWGIALAGAMVVLSQVEASNRKIEQTARAAERAYRDMAKAAADAGQIIGGTASQEAAQKRLLELGNTQMALAERNVTILDTLRGAAPDQAWIDLMTGVDSKGAEAATQQIQTLIGVLEDSRGSKPDWLANFIDGDTQPTIDALQSIINQAGEAKTELANIWGTKIGREAAITGVLEGITHASEGAKVSLGNINNIQRDVFGNTIQGWETGANKVTQFATTFSTAMGGSNADLIRHFNLTKTAIQDFQGAARPVGDVYDYITRAMVRAKAPTAAITDALQRHGLSAEEAARRIQFVWGPAADAFGKALTVNGQQVPKLYELSNGVIEFSNALGAATNIDPSVLARVFQINGFDPTKFGPAMVTAGLGIDQVRSALQAMGTPSPVIGQTLAAIAEGAGKLNAQGIMNPLKIAEFAKALDEVRNSAEGASEAADGIYEAFKRLQPGADSFDLGVQFADAGRAITDMMAAADGAGAAVGTLAQAFDSANGKLDPNVKGIGEVKSALEDFATAGVGKAIQAYKDEMQVSGDSVAARAKLRESIADMGPVLDSLRSGLEAANGEATVTDEAWRNFLTTLGLTPDQVEILAIANTDGAVGKMAELSALLHSVAPGVTVRAEALTDDAAAKLQALGLIVEKGPDGVYTVRTSADPTEAQAQLAGFQELLRNEPITAEVNIHTDATKEKILAQLQGIPISIDLQARIDTALATMNSLNGTPVYASASAIIDKAMADISQLNGTNVEADAGAIIDKALADIAALNGTPVTANAGGDTSRLFADIIAREGTRINADVGGNLWRAMGDIAALNGTRVYASVSGDTGPARSAINSLSGMSVFVNVVAQGLSGIRNQIFGFLNADGNLVNPGGRIQQFSGGGFSENHVAQIAGAGTWRVWAEPETGGEAYIPLSPAKRSRSMAILTEVASRFGYSLTKLNQNVKRFAEGSSGAAEGQQTASVIVNQYNPKTEKDSVSLRKAAQLLAAR